MTESPQGMRTSSASYGQPQSTTMLLCRLHAFLQAQRDFFGSHTYQRTDKEGWFHTVWDENFGSADSITTSSYIA